jgi:hypothetical protein
MVQFVQEASWHDWCCVSLHDHIFPFHESYEKQQMPLLHPNISGTNIKKDPGHQLFKQSSDQGLHEWIPVVL